jgi:hypothetical protein
MSDPVTICLTKSRNFHFMIALLVSIQIYTIDFNLGLNCGVTTMAKVEFLYLSTTLKLIQAIFIILPSYTLFLSF